MRSFPSIPVADAYAGFVTAFAEEQGLHCSVSQINGHVTVSLASKSARGHLGITRTVLAIAKRLK